jgi:DNA uptake protein ComE-like DNA-binding protein
LLIVCLLASGGPSWAVDAPRLDLNRATETELAALPGIGKVRAQAIAKRRAELRFARPEELLGVPGIGPGIYAGLRDRIEVSSEPDPAEK